MLIILAVLVILVTLLLSAAALSIYGYRNKSEWVGVSEKTFWDWLSILIVPMLLAVGGVLFTAYQGVRQQQIEKLRAQDTALQAYLDQMNSLLLEHNLRGSATKSDVKTLARARTLTVLDSLDNSRERQVMLFLIEAGLVRSESDGELPDITLTRVNLSHADLGPTVLGLRLNLSGAILGEANLRYADLTSADLNGAWLTGADLSDATLSSADLSSAILNGATLNGADLSNATLYKSQVKGTNLSDAVLSHADLSYASPLGADFEDADLSDADLSGALLSGADLSGALLVDANLSSSILSEANLSGADLTDAKVTEEQLEQAKSLEGATMPDGSKHP
jgi:uncharacterized protein YjbI with pentapeptide repeats